MSRNITPRAYQKSVKGAGALTLLSGTQRSDHGKLRRSHASAARKVSRANSMRTRVVQLVDRAKRVERRFSPQELALAVPPLANMVGTPLVSAGEGLIGFTLGWSLGGGDNQLIEGWGKAIPILFGLAYCLVFAGAGFFLAEAAGKYLGRMHAKADSASLKPSASDRQRGPEDSRFPAAMIMGITGALLASLTVFLFAANQIRELFMSTTSVQVNPMMAATLGIVLPAAMALFKGWWYSREAAVELYHLDRKAVKGMREHRKLHSDAAGAVAKFDGFKVNALGNAWLADQNQEGVDSEKKVAELLERLKVATLHELPQDIVDKYITDADAPDASGADEVIGRDEAADTEANDTEDAKVTDVKWVA